MYTRNNAHNAHKIFIFYLIFFLFFFFSLLVHMKQTKTQVYLYRYQYQQSISHWSATRGINTSLALKKMVTSVQGKLSSKVNCSKNKKFSKMQTNVLTMYLMQHIIGNNINIIRFKII